MTEPHYTDDLVTLHHGDCLDVLRELPDASVDAVVTDPPYGLGFMGREWDSLPPGEEWARECLRVLKPGGHLLAFGGTRTWHRLACAVEDAGFEVRDSIAWMYGSGFPKSLDVSKAIDKRRDWSALPRLQAKVREARAALGISQSEAARRCGLIGPDESLGGGGFMWFETGMRLPTREQYPRLKAALALDDECDQAFEEAEREVLSSTTTNRTDDGSWASQVRSGMFKEGEQRVDITAPATDAARTWQGWGTALKPAFEPVVVARKPLAGTVAGNVLAHGTGALNIDGCRVHMSDEDADFIRRTARPNTAGQAHEGDVMNRPAAPTVNVHPAGRWPANVVLDESQAAALDEMSGELTSGANPTRRGSDKFRDAYGDFAGQEECTPARGADSGGASRFFYVAKADASERVRVNGTAHPTVKPLALMRWLVRLVTPSGGVVLEPFAGSGTTVEACLLEGFRVVAIEREADYLPLVLERVNRRREGALPGFLDALEGA